MNLSLSLKKLATKQYVLTARERLMLIIGIGVIVFAVILYITPSEVAVESTVPTNTVGKAVTNTNNSLAPTGEAIAQGNSTNQQPLRDPFAKPPEISKNPAPSNVSPSNAPPSAPPIHNNVPNMVPSIVPNAPVTNMPQRDFKLTGIVSAGNHYVAVIMSGSKSKSYDVNDAIGAYHITTITNDYVVLTGSGQKITLRLE